LTDTAKRMLNPADRTEISRRFTKVVSHSSLLPRTLTEH